MWICFYYNTNGLEWDAIHLCIANNLDWMKVWIERCKEYNNGRLSWECVSTLVKEDELKWDTNLTQRKIDLAHGLKYKAKIFIHTTYFFNIILMHMACFFLIFVISKYKYVYELTMFFLRVWHIAVETL